MKETRFHAKNVHKASLLSREKIRRQGKCFSIKSPLRRDLLVVNYLFDALYALNFVYGKCPNIIRDTQKLVPKNKLFAYIEGTNNDFFVGHSLLARGFRVWVFFKKKLSLHLKN